MLELLFPVLWKAAMPIQCGERERERGAAVKLRTIKFQKNLVRYSSSSVEVRTLIMCITVLSKFAGSFQDDGGAYLSQGN